MCRYKIIASVSGLPLPQSTAYARLRLLIGADSSGTGESMEAMIQRELRFPFAYQVQVHKDHMTKLVQVHCVVAV